MDGLALPAQSSRHEKRPARPSPNWNEQSDSAGIGRVGREVAEESEAIGGEVMSPKLWSVREVAEFLGLAVGTVYHLLSQKRLPCVRLSARCVRFDPKAIEERVAQRTEEPEAE